MISPVKPRYFTIEGKILAVNQDCSLQEFFSIEQAYDTNPICVLKTISTYENILVRNLWEEWYQYSSYSLFSPILKQRVEAIRIGNWSLNNLFLPRSGDKLHFDTVDPLGKVARQEVFGKQSDLLSKVFSKIREMSSYESLLTYTLVEENYRLRQELEALKNSDLSV